MIRSYSGGLLLGLGGKGTDELVLLFGSLELTVTDLGGGIDELDLGLEGGEGIGRSDERLPDSDLSLLWSHDVTSEEHVVLLDDTVVRESTNWGDVLTVWVLLGGGVILGSSAGTFSDSVDLLVELGSVEVTLVTSSSDGPLNSGWMPSTDTGNSSETSVGLSWESGDTESLHDTGGSVSSGNGNGIDHLILGEDGSDSDLLLELSSGPCDLVGNASTVDLDFHEVSLPLSELELLDLGAAENSDYRAVFLDSVNISVDVILRRGLLGIFLGILGESLLGGDVVVLVESSNDAIWKFLSPDSGESSETSWGFDVSNHTDDLHWWALNDGDWFDDIFLDSPPTFSLLHTSDNVGHTGFVTHEGSEMDWLGLIVSWEGSDLTLVMLGSSLWKITQVTASWMLKLSVRHA